MNTEVTDQRWNEAQFSESSYWLNINVGELLRICAEKPEFLKLLPEDCLKDFFNDREVMEVGVGPLGISLASFYPFKDSITRLVKIEPLPQIQFTGLDAANTEKWAFPFLDWLATLSKEGSYEQTPGEQLTFKDKFDSIIIYNVLDHVQSPQKIIDNAFKSLKTGGKILVGVDCYSVLGQIKFEQFLRRTQSGTIMVDAHPHTFTPSQVVTMLQEAGFCDVISYGIPSKIKVFAGSVFRPAFIANKL
jgi:SAM-dependent methyltransferase